MANEVFHARIERIQRAHAKAAAPSNATFRTPGIAGVAAAQGFKRRARNPIREHLASIAFGLVLGCLVAVGLIGLSQDGTSWATGTPWHDIVYYVTMAGLALAPVMVLVSMMVAARRPAFALFSLGYLSGVVVPLFL